MAGAAIAGVQSNRIVSTVKHFALNAQEKGRMVLDARIDEASLRESDLLAFEIANATGRPGLVMFDYNKVKGDWARENAHLRTNVHRKYEGLDDWLLADWRGVRSRGQAAH